MENLTLIDKIQTGYFDTPLLDEINKLSKQLETTYQYAYDNYIGDNEEYRVDAALSAVHSDKVKLRRLYEKSWKKELMKLHELRKALHREFGTDLWNDAMEANLSGDGTVMDLYNWYEKNSK